MFLTWTQRLVLALAAAFIALVITSALGYDGDDALGAVLVVIVGTLWATSRTRWLMRHTTLVEPEYLVSRYAEPAYRKRPRPVYPDVRRRGLTRPGRPRKGLVRFEK
jgi:hypothetical protein